MTTNLALWPLILLCFSMAGAVGGGLYQHIVLTPAHMECVAASFVFNHTTRYGGAPSTVLDPRACGYQYLHSRDALLDLE
jgi:hypothetical protein